jgi:hypothetical protein
VRSTKLSYAPEKMPQNGSHRRGRRKAVKDTGGVERGQASEALAGETVANVEVEALAFGLGGQRLATIERSTAGE